MLIDLRSLFQRRPWLFVGCLLLLLLALMFLAPVRRRSPERPPGAVPVYDWPARTTVILGPGL